MSTIIHIISNTLEIKDGRLIPIESKRGTITLRLGFIMEREQFQFFQTRWEERHSFSKWSSVNFFTESAQADPISQHTNLKSLLLRIKPI